MSAGWTQSFYCYIVGDRGMRCVATEAHDIADAVRAEARADIDADDVTDWLARFPSRGDVLELTVHGRGIVALVVAR